MEEKARGQQYLKPYEEDVVVKYLLQMSDLGQPIRMKFIPMADFGGCAPCEKIRHMVQPGVCRENENFSAR
jgi:hypothetical protein